MNTQLMQLASYASVLHIIVEKGLNVNDPDDVKDAALLSAAASDENLTDEELEDFSTWFYNFRAGLAEQLNLD